MTQLADQQIADIRRRAERRGDNVTVTICDVARNPRVAAKLSAFCSADLCAELERLEIAGHPDASDRASAYLAAQEGR